MLCFGVSKNFLLCVRDWLNQRYSWYHEKRAVNTLPDLFIALKYSYSSLLSGAHRVGDVNLVVAEKGKARVSDVCRSYSI